MTSENNTIPGVDISVQDKKAESTKIELVVNKPQNDTGAVEIDLLNIFSFMKKKKAIYIRLLAFALVLSLSIGCLIYQFQKESNNAVAVITFSYDGAEKGLAPDGKSALDISAITSSNIITAAIDDAKVGGKKVTAATVAENITISRVMDEKSAQQLELLGELTSTSTNYYTAYSEFNPEYTNMYVVTLKNGLGLSDSGLSLLLESIVAEYEEYFFLKYGDYIPAVDYFSSIDVSDYEYLDAFDTLREGLESLKDYCEEKARQNPDYRDSANGLSYSDVAEIIQNTIETEIDAYYSDAFVNGVTKDKTVLLQTYEYRLRSYKLQLEKIESKLESLTQTIEKYEQDKMVVTSGGEDTVQYTVESTTDYYNSLILQKAEYIEDKNETEHNIALLGEKISLIEKSSSTVSDSMISKVEKNIEQALSSCKKIYGIVENMTSGLFESAAYKNSDITAITAMTGSESGMIKTVATSAAVGIVIALLIWCCDGLICELKRTSNGKKVKEEEVK